jgi:hypothetical protein
VEIEPIRELAAWAALAGGLGGRRQGGLQWTVANGDCAADAVGSLGSWTRSCISVAWTAEETQRGRERYE